MEQQTVHLFVFEGFADWEAAYAVAGINSYRQFQLRPGQYAVRTVGAGAHAVRTMGGVTVVPDMTVEDLTRGSSAMLILPGGTAWDEGKNSEVLQIAGVFLRSGVPVAGICGATAGLARAGLLDSKRHTSNAREYLKMTGYRGEDLYQDAPAVTDGDLITAGGMSPVDFARHIFEKLGLYNKPVLDAWCGLFKTGDASYYTALLEASAGTGNTIKE